jgi:tetratricopeptide (TPR) repeat protein
VKSLSKNSFIYTLLAGTAAACSLIWMPVAWSQSGPAKGVTQTTPLQIKPRVVETEEIRLRAGQLPDVSLTSNILFRILAAEISAQRSVFIPAGKTMLDLARELGDYRLARRGLEFYLAGGNLAGALDAARLWLRISPDDAEAVSTEMALSAASGQTSGLTEALRKQIDAASDKTVAIGQAVAVLSRMPDRAVAFTILDRAINASNARNTLAARLALADIAQLAGEQARALTEAKAALTATPRSEDAAMRVFEYGLKVDPEQAQKDARLFISANPDARRLRLMLTGYFTDQRDFDAAMKELVAMSKRAPEDFDLMFMQAQVAYRAKQLDQARGLLEQFVSVQSQRQRANAEGATDASAALSDAYILLARVFEEQGRLDDAVAQLAKIEDPASRHGARLRQALIRARQGKIDQALAIIDAAGPDSDEEVVLGVTTAAQILRDANRIDDAIARLKVADQQQPDTVEIKYELAMLYERRGQLKDTERLLREVIALDSGHAHSYNALGYALADRNQRLPEALKLITRALEISPQDPFIMDSMGWVKYRMGDRVAAVDYLSRAYAKRPETDIAAHLGEVLWVNGQRDEALKILREGAAKEPQNPVLLETVRRLGVKL